MLFRSRPPPDSNRGQRVLVLNARRTPAGLLVDEIAGYRQFAASEQRNEMKRSAEPFAPFLLGAFVREGHPWYVFSLHRLAHSETFRAAAACTRDSSRLPSTACTGFAANSIRAWRVPPRCASCTPTTPILRIRSSNPT